MPGIQQMLVLLGLFASVEATKFTTGSDERLAALEEDVVALKAQLKEFQTSGCKRHMPLPEEIGFTSKLSTVDLRKSQHIKFNQVVSNMGSAYDNTMGVFIAPVSGTYLFYATVLILCMPHVTTVTELVKNGDQLFNVKSGNATFAATDRGGIMVIVPLNAGDRVWVRVYSSDDYAFTFEGIFSGYLLRRDEGGIFNPVIG